MDTVPARGEPGRAGDGLAAAAAFFQVRQEAVDLEKPDLEIAGQDGSFSAGLERLESGQQQPVNEVFPGAGREEFLDELGKVGQGEGRGRLLLNFKERFDQVAGGNSHQIPALLLVIENLDEGHGLQKAAEPVAELAGALGHAPQQAFVPGEKSDDLILVGEGRALEDDGFSLVQGHGDRLRP